MSMILQSHQGRGRGGDLVLGVGGIVVVRGDRPAHRSLAFVLDLRHRERKDLAAGLVELDHFEAGHLLRVFEVGIEQLVVHALGGGVGGGMLLTRRRCAAAAAAITKIKVFTSLVHGNSRLSVFDY